MPHDSEDFHQWKALAVHCVQLLQTVQVIPDIVQHGLIRKKTWKRFLSNLFTVRFPSHGTYHTPPSSLTSCTLSFCRSLSLTLFLHVVTLTYLHCLKAPFRTFSLKKRVKLRQLHRTVQICLTKALNFRFLSSYPFAYYKVGMDASTTDNIVLELWADT